MTAEITEEPVQPVQDEAGAPSEEAPYGWMTDPDTGLRRPKKRPGRRSKTATPPTGTTPALEELQALGALPEASEDAAPGAPPKGKRKSARTEALPPFRAGVIAKGINKLYRRAGRIIRLFDNDIGVAVIATTQADPDDDDPTTVGDAWENLARTNPRIRAFLLKLVTGGAWSAVFEAHLPILLAIVMKDGIRSRLPLMGLMESFLTDEPDGDDGEPQPSGLAQMMGGISPDDMAQMIQMGQMMMGQAAANVPRAQGVPREPVNGAAWAQEAPREHSGPQE